MNTIKNKSSWRLVSEWDLNEIPASIRSWLLEPGSMTQRLKDTAKYAFHINLCFQDWQKPDAEELKVLQVPETEDAVIREVQLMCDEKPWLYGRSVFPKSTLTDKEIHFHTLGTRSLGDTLFYDPTFTRSEFEIALLIPGQFEFERAVSWLDINIQPKNLWGRRSLCYVSKKPLLLTEIFLPDMPDVLETPHD